VKEFLEEFAGPQQQYEWGQQLSMLKQLPGESIAKFNATWTDLSSRSDPGARAYQPGKVNEYLSAILPELQFHVRLRAPRNIKEAMEYARNAETAIRSTGRTVGVKMAQTETRDALKEEIAEIKALFTQRTETRTCNLCNKVGHIAVNCKTRTINQEKQRQGVCFNCNKPGHMKKDCKEKKKFYCTNCRKEGHTNDRCWKKNQDNRQSFDQNKVYDTKRKIINGKPMKVFYVEEELDAADKLALAVEQLNNNIKNLKV
jgi:hypothetical protein